MLSLSFSIGTGYRPSSFLSAQPSCSYLNNSYDACFYYCCHFKSRCRCGICRTPSPCYQVGLCLLLHLRCSIFALLCRPGRAPVRPLPRPDKALPPLPEKLEPLRGPPKPPSPILKPLQIPGSQPPSNGPGKHVSIIEPFNKPSRPDSQPQSPQSSRITLANHPGSNSPNSPITPITPTTLVNPESRPLTPTDPEKKLEPVRRPPEPEKPPEKPPPMGPVQKAVTGEAVKSVVAATAATIVIAGSNGLIGQPP